MVAEEQGGFRSGWGCGDQVLTLVLLGQMKKPSKKGMFAAGWTKRNDGFVWREWGLVAGLLPS